MGVNRLSRKVGGILWRFGAIGRILGQAMVARLDDCYLEIDIYS